VSPRLVSFLHYSASMTQFLNVHASSSTDRKSLPCHMSNEVFYPQVTSPENTTRFIVHNHTVTDRISSSLCKVITSHRSLILYALCSEVNTLCLKKGSIKLIPVSLSHLNGFSKFFHRRILPEICSKVKRSHQTLNVSHFGVRLHVVNIRS